jgi:uncharacterized membrane protein
LNRNALNRSGAMAAAVVGCCTLGCSLRLGATLLAFFFASSKLTQVRDSWARPEHRYPAGADQRLS